MPDQPYAGFRLLFVHAHPDDETITTGATMASYAAAGASVTLVTCTLGEEGEILVPDVTHLAPDGDDRLGEHRRGELAAAMASLGVRDWRLLGAPGRYRDSGMIGTPANERPECFWRADLREAADDLVPVLREVRPHVLVTYGDDGGYGHPDHVQAHRVATYALALAAAPSYRPALGAAWDVPKVYWTAVPRSAVERGIALVRAGGSPFRAVEADDIPYGVPDDWVTTTIDARAHLPAKVAALRAYATQVTVVEPFFALSNGVGQPLDGVEHYRLVKGRPGPATGPERREDDLFAGLTS